MNSKFIITGPASNYVPDPRGLGVLLMESMQKYKNNIAQIDADTGHVQTYGAILAKSVTLAQNLQRRGITRNDMLALCSSNTLLSDLPLNACLLLSVPMATLDPSLSLNDVKHSLNITRPRLVFCESDSVGLMAQAIEENSLDTGIVDLDSIGRHVPFSSLLIETQLEDEFEARPVSDLRETALILFSSGTTGLSKGICIHHYGLLMQQQHFEPRIPNGVILSWATLYWISSNLLHISCYLNGETRVVCRKFDENTVTSIVQDYKVTACIMAPIHASLITKTLLNTNHDMSSLKAIVIVGGLFMKSQKLELSKHFPNVNILVQYGTTEAHGLITKFPRDDDQIVVTKIDSCGRPLTGLKYKIVDVDTGEILGPNKSGEICVKSRSIFDEYYNNPEATLAAWDADGYFRTGDVGYYDEEQYFFIVDRIKDLLKYRSWHVQPAELESILLTHPEVKEAGVIGIPHETDGDHPVGFVVLTPGSTGTAEELVDFVNERVSNWKKLRGGLRIIDSMPRTPSGKLRKEILRSLIVKNESVVL